jgi:hypothetical protein
VAGCCEHGNESSGSIKDMVCLEGYTACSYVKNSFGITYI